ncbi:acetolactate synthase [Aspergillus uvarum CBS 121591]|uniref:Acetolactate synthase n=1 Tax=Aspergillus uvarum CBS 121591 TaxID=1448315 RepID=A0A319C4E7_9EURO|nr:acetolactate synthase [Aspergillus uvarum CBS 121591]PYH79041.1 acetolactate synthase [Aspergillus uvarum CBS 121591]
MGSITNPITGAEVFHEMLHRLEVKAVFGYNGAAVVSIFDAIYQSPYFTFVLPRHEQGAGHMAQGYARATQSPGVVLVTSGPGTSNMVTPVLDAAMDSTPLVVFCGQVPQQYLGTHAFQEIPTEQIMWPCAKACFTVTSVEALPPIMVEAFRTAGRGRPGPVVVVLPRDISTAALDRSEMHRAMMSLPLPLPAGLNAWGGTVGTSRITDEQVATIAEMINQSERPVILAGQGVVISPRGARMLNELAQTATIAVTTTLPALGCFNEEDPKSLGMVGQYGSAAANLAVRKADLLLVFGARLDDRVVRDAKTFALKARKSLLAERIGVVQINIDEAHLNDVIPAGEAVACDVGDAISRVLPRVHRRASRPGWMGQQSTWKGLYPFKYEEEDGGGQIMPQAVLEELDRHLKGQSKPVIITTGVGQHQMWATQFLRWTRQRKIITSGSLGTMGFGLPAAIGAKVARPDALVIDLDGDSSFCMTMEELLSASQAGVDVKVIVFNNQEQGMVTEWQTTNCDKRYSHSHQSNPRFGALAEAMGVQARVCSSVSDLPGKLSWLLQTRSAALLEVRVASKLRQVVSFSDLK